MERKLFRQQPNFKQATVKSLLPLKSQLAPRVPPSPERRNTISLSYRRHRTPSSPLSTDCVQYVKPGPSDRAFSFPSSVANADTTSDNTSVFCIMHLVGCSGGKAFSVWRDSVGSLHAQPAFRESDCQPVPGSCGNHCGVGVHKRSPAYPRYCERSHA